MLCRVLQRARPSPLCLPIGACKPLFSHAHTHTHTTTTPQQYVKIQFFLFVLGMCGLAVMWRSAATGVGAAAGLAISQTVGDVLAVLAAVAYILVSLL